MLNLCVTVYFQQKVLGFEIIYLITCRILLFSASTDVRSHVLIHAKDHVEHDTFSGMCYMTSQHAVI